jgi:type VI protein secretion system component Hcp
MVSQSLELHSVHLRQGSDRSSTSTSMYATKGPAVPGSLFRKVRTVPKGKADTYIKLSLVEIWSSFLVSP